MEKIFGLQAHEDAKNILAAIQQKNEEEEAKWEGLKELLNSCWDHQVSADPGHFAWGFVCSYRS